MPVHGPLRLSARAGDERSLETIFRRHHAPLLSYCRHMLGDQDEAEDALQQAFIKAHQALLGGTVPRELRPWLYAIARNCCLSAIAARKSTAPLEDHTPALAGLSEEVHQREDLRELVAGIGRLPEDQRSALLLAELDDLSHQAIATIVECPVSKVKALIYQARSALIAERDARNTPCQDIREQLAVARGGELRRGPLRRHLKLCSGCRDFQLAVSAQRQSLAAVLPVLPSAGLAAAILGHGAAHAAGAAAGGTGITASGTAATTTVVGAGAGGGTSVGTLIGGGLVTKLAAAGAVVALAAAGAATVHNRQARANPHHPVRLRLASSNMARRRISVADIASSSPLGQGPSTSYAIVNEIGPAGAPGTAPSASAGPPGLGGTDPLLTPSGALAPSGAAPGGPGQPPVAAGQGKGGATRDPGARTQHRAVLRRRQARLRRRAQLLHRRAVRRRARLHKALRRRRRPATTPIPKPAVTPVPVPTPTRTRHRKALPTQTPSTTGQSTGTTAGGGESKTATGPRHRPAAGTGPASTGTGAGTGQAGASTGAGKTGSGKAGSKAGSEKTGADKAPGSGSGAVESSSASTPSKTKTGSGEASGTGGVKGSAGGSSGATTGTSAKAGAGTTSGTDTAGHAKKHLVEEEQLPNL